MSRPQYLARDLGRASRGCVKKATERARATRDRDSRFARRDATRDRARIARGHRALTH
jgi:hypothetical protein